MADEATEIKMEMYPEWIKGSPPSGVEPIPFKKPSELPPPAWFKEDDFNGLVPARTINGIYRCTRCGMCEKALFEKSLPCDVPWEERTGPVSFRHRIAITRGLIEGRLKVEDIPERHVKLWEQCHFCLSCVNHCIVNAPFMDGISEEPNLDHQGVGTALLSLIKGVPYVSPPCNALKRREPAPF